LVPLRDAFGALFFVSLGTLIDPRLLADSLPLLGLMLLLIVVGKFLVWVAVVRMFRYSIRTAIAVAAGLTQIGELSFVVAKAGRSAGVVSEDVFSTVIAASLISILLNVFIVRGTLWWLASKSPKRGAREANGGAVVPAIQQELFVGGHVKDGSVGAP
jgi:CPA2 family monovalent cation:H+ antiporter-2